MDLVYSKNNIPLRLTFERWVHIVESHDELAGRIHEVLETIAEPDIIVEGSNNELLASKNIDNKYLVVVYKETGSTDGFIITAFETTKITYILKKKTAWKKTF